MSWGNISFGFAERIFAFLGEAPIVKCKGAVWGKTMEGAQGQAALQKNGRGILELVWQAEDRISFNRTWVEILRREKSTWLQRIRLKLEGVIAKQKLPSLNNRDGWGGFSAVMFGSSSLSCFPYCYIIFKLNKPAVKSCPSQQPWSRTDQPRKDQVSCNDRRRHMSKNRRRCQETKDRWTSGKTNG